MKITLLGTGTSTGVPVVGCACRVCTSPDEKNKRLRTSIFIEVPQSGTAVNILVDTGTDLRQQMLRAGIKRIDAVLYTHSHADHVFGIDDLRPFNFLQRAPVQMYAPATAAADLRRIFGYCFEQNPEYEGGAQPDLVLNEIDPGLPLEICGVTILPLAVFHGRMPILGFRVGNFAYLTDCSAIPEETAAQLQGLEVLVLDGLRERPHRTHFTIFQAVEEVERLKPAKTYLTHISHELDHSETNEKLITMTARNVELAYDGLTITL